MPIVPESHLNLGLIAVAVGDVQQAEQAYKTALRLDARFSPAYVNLADLYRQQGRDQDGERVLRCGYRGQMRTAPICSMHSVCCWCARNA